MFVTRFASALIAATALSLGGLGSGASAADLKVKAKAPPPTPWVLDVHGGADFTLANTRVTGSGLLLYPTSSAIFQQTIWLDLDIYKDKSTFINSFSIFGGVWNETYTDPNGFQTSFRHWQEMDWWGGFNVGFAEHWGFNYQHLEFNFPWVSGGIQNDIFKLSFDDSYWGFPITVNPYFLVFYVEGGGSPPILGARSNIYRMEAGISPTYSFMKSSGLPLTISVPTSVTFGPNNYWNRNDGTTNLCGATSTSPCALSNFGYFSTGLQGKYTISDMIVPKRLGSWYLKGGVQWFHILNDALLGAQGTGGLPAGSGETAFAGTGVVAGFPQAKKDIAVVNVGTGFSF
jgi:hypothetical protein